MPRVVKQDQPVGHLQDRRSGAVVLFQPHDLRVRPVSLEAENVRHLGAAPAVDRLIVVPYHAQVAVSGRQGFDDPVLRAVGVLILVDEQVREPRRLLLPRLGKALKQLLRQQQQVVEIDGPRQLERFLIPPIAAGRQMLLVRAGQAGRLVRPDACRFPAADRTHQVSRPEHFSRDLNLPQGSAGHAFLIAPVINGELLGISQLPAMPSQHAHAQRVKGRDLRLFRQPPPQQRRGALLHFARRLLGERDRQDARRPNAAANQFRDSVRHHARLAASRPRQHQQRPLQRHHRFALRWVEVRVHGQIVRDVERR